MRAVTVATALGAVCLLLLASAFSPQPVLQAQSLTPAPLPTPAPELNKQPFTIITEGTITMTTTTKRASVGYTTTFSDADTTFIAEHYNLFVFNPDLNGSAGATAVKAKNSAVMTLAYRELHTMYTGYDDWATVNAHEDWFLHTSGGQRIQNLDYYWYLMDAGSAGWREHFVSHANTTYLNTAAYDGLFADDVHDELPNWWNLSGELQEADIASWHSDVSGMLAYVQANLLEGKLFFINSDQLGEYDYVQYVDGVYIEDYCHPEWLTDSQHNEEWFVVQKLVDFNYITNTLEKYCVSATGTLTRPVTDYILKYNLAAHLLGINNGKGYFAFNTFINDPAQGYYAIADVDIGTVSGAYYSSQNVYWRDFADGLVLWNPSSSNYNVDLGGTYYTLDLEQVTSVSLLAYSGEILYSSAQIHVPVASAIYSMMRRR
jgi:hypothetical protein